MGVPKFYRWISERYPALSEIVRENQIPEFDNLYLDMNGIIHSCSHPNDDDVHFRITEEEIFRNIFRYIDFLFGMIKPRKVFFMAVDGVAPRAKMNQQRGRRFRSAQDALEKEAEAKRKGETLPTEARFDSNCITPGTPFMVRLQKALEYYVTQKINVDPLWRDIKVILSGHETPGEGEHKVMDYIRYQKSQPKYDPNTRHCLYGLDADLMMLGMASHEPYFSLLREEVKFMSKREREKDQIRKKSRQIDPNAITFHLLHLSLLRDYLDLEFASLKRKLPFGYDLESIIDDWILMGFLNGNDFLPHLPNMHINKDSFQLMYTAYKKIMPTLDGYLNEKGTLNLGRFKKFLQTLANVDEEQFEEVYADLKYFESKTGRSMKKLEDTSAFFEGALELASEADALIPTASNLEKAIELSMEQTKEVIGATGSLPSSDNDDTNDEDASSGDEEEEEMDEETTFAAEFRLHKDDYYKEKLNYAKITPEVLREQAAGYIRAIQWNLHYYYDGCQSWSWYYPHHYAPYISDICEFGITDVDLKFERGEPFKPFEQLLAVLPAASKQFLPRAYQHLVTSQTSPLIDYYPTNFELDLNGKQQSWEAVVKIPFIDEKLLVEATTMCVGSLSPEERARNIHGPHLLFTYSPQDLGHYPSPMPQVFPSIHHNHARIEEIHKDVFRLEPKKIKKGLLPGVQLDVFMAGFPTLRHLPFHSVLKKDKIRVFNYPSQNDSMILMIEQPSNPPDPDQVARKYLGQIVFINWPHLKEALVVGISDAENIWQKDTHSDKIICRKVEDKEHEDFCYEIQRLKRHLKERMGIYIGSTDLVFYVTPIIEKKLARPVRGRPSTVEKVWAPLPLVYPYQITVKNLKVYEPLLGKVEKSSQKPKFSQQEIIRLVSQAPPEVKQRLASQVPEEMKLKLAQARGFPLPQPQRPLQVQNNKPPMANIIPRQNAGPKDGERDDFKELWSMLSQMKVNVQSKPDQSAQQQHQQFSGISASVSALLGSTGQVNTSPQVQGFPAGAISVSAFEALTSKQQAPEKPSEQPSRADVGGRSRGISVSDLFASSSNKSHHVADINPTASQQAAFASLPVQDKPPASRTDNPLRSNQEELESYCARIFGPQKKVMYELIQVGPMRQASAVLTLPDGKKYDHFIGIGIQDAPQIATHTYERLAKRALEDLKRQAPSCQNRISPSSFLSSVASLSNLPNLPPPPPNWIASSAIEQQDSNIIPNQIPQSFVQSNIRILQRETGTKIDPSQFMGPMFDIQMNEPSRNATQSGQNTSSAFNNKGNRSFKDRASYNKQGSGNAGQDGDRFKNRDSQNRVHGSSNPDRDNRPKNRDNQPQHRQQQSGFGDSRDNRRANGSYGQSRRYQNQDSRGQHQNYNRDSQNTRRQDNRNEHQRNDYQSAVPNENDKATTFQQYKKNPFIPTQVARKNITTKKEAQEKELQEYLKNKAAAKSQPSKEQQVHSASNPSASQSNQARAQNNSTNKNLEKGNSATENSAPVASKVMSCKDAVAAEEKPKKQKKTRIALNL